MSLYRKPRVLRKAPLAARLVPEGRRPLPASTEGEGEGRLLVSEAAVQAEMAVLEPSVVALLQFPIWFFRSCLIDRCWRGTILRSCDWAGLCSASCTEAGQMD